MKSRILLLLAAVALSGCPGTLDNPEDFREGGSSGGGGSCPPGTNVETDILGKATGSGCATKICHDAQDPAGNLDLASPGLASRLLDQTSTSTDCSGHVLVDSANPSQSLLLEKLATPAPCGDPMPLTGSLTAQEKACITEHVNGLTGSGQPQDAGTD